MSEPFSDPSEPFSDPVAEPSSEPTAEPLSEPTAESLSELDETPGVTGHATVDGALAGLAQAASLPPAEQVGAYEAAHEALQQTLSTIDQS
jgi:hypothetical protein